MPRTRKKASVVEGAVDDAIIPKKRRKPQCIPGSPAENGVWKQPPSVLTDWKIDAATGVRSRELVTEGETPHLKDERPQQ